MSTTHDLKTWPEFFGAILDGRKTFEVRDTRDRDFAVGDVLRLREWTPGDGCRPGSYTGREATRTVSYIVRGAPFLPADLAVLGLIDDGDGVSAEHWRAQYVKQVNLRHERNKESDARVAAVTAERDAALARTERWKREHEGLHVDFVALAEEKMTLRAQVESALGGKPVQDPVSDAVILAQRVAQEREVAVRDGEAIRKAIGLDADASTTSVLARLAETHPDLLASGERATFLRRSGAETRQARDGASVLEPLPGRDRPGEGQRAPGHVQRPGVGGPRGGRGSRDPPVCRLLHLARSGGGRRVAAAFGVGGHDRGAGPTPARV